MKIQFIKILKNKIFKNSLYLFADKIIRLLGGLLVGSLIAKYLGPEQYGRLSYTVVFSTLFISFSMMGIDNLIIRDLTKGHNSEEGILGTALKIRMLGSVFSAITAILIAYIFHHDDVILMILIAIQMISNIFQSMDVISLWYQSKMKVEVIVQQKIKAYISVLLLKIIAVLCGMSIVFFALCSSVEIFLGLFLLVYHYKRFDKSSMGKWQFSKKTASSFLKEGWKLALSNFSIIVFMKSDQIFLNNIVGSSAAGIYYVAVMLLDVFYSIPMFTGTSLFPKLTELYNNNHDKYIEYVNKAFLGITLYSYISLIGIFSFSDFFILFFFGENYYVSSSILKIYSISMPFVAIGCIRGFLLIIERKSAVSSVITISGGVLNIILNLVLIPQYGIYGAVYSVIIVQITVNYFSGIFIKSLREMFIYQTQAFFLYPIIRYAINYNKKK